MIKKISFFFIVLLSIYASFHLLSSKAIILDKIYVINLDRSSERYAYMSNILNSLNLPLKHEKFKAIDGNDIIFLNTRDNSSLSGKEIIEKKLLLKGNFNIICPEIEDHISAKLDWDHYHPRAIGELGHLCSSRALWKKIIDNNYKNTLIMEDDLKFIQDFSNSLEQATNNAPNNYDILYLNLGNFGKAYKSNVQNEYLKIVMNFFDQHIKNPFWKQARRNVRSAKAYIVNPDGARKLLDCTKSSPKGAFLAADIKISKCIENGQITAYVSKPQLAKGNDHFKSDVGEY
jgi:GR25 family glycosyltransferase involved in LPS biosynthesis